MGYGGYVQLLEEDNENLRMDLDRSEAEVSRVYQMLFDAELKIKKLKAELLERAEAHEAKDRRRRP